MRDTMQPIKSDFADVIDLINRQQIAQEMLNRTIQQRDQGFATDEQVLQATERMHLLGDAASEAAAELGMLPSQVVQLNASLDSLGDATGPIEVRDRAAETLAMIQQWYPTAKELPEGLRDTVTQLDGIVQQTAEVTATIDQGVIAANNLADAAAGISFGIAIADSAAVVDNLMLAAAYAAELNEAQGNGPAPRLGFGLPGTGVTTSEPLGFGRLPGPDRPATNLGSPTRGGGGRSGGGGGRSGGSDDFAQRLERLIDAQRTETEVIEDWYAENLALLNDSRAQQLLGEEDYLQARERLHAEYNERLQRMNERQANDGVTTVLQAGQQILGAIGQNNEKALKAAQTFAAAEALVNTYRAAAQALADPTVPFWGKFAAVASVVSSGIGLVNSIKSMGSSGAGGGAATGSTSAAAAAASGGQGPIEFRLSGLGPNDLLTGADVGALLDRLSDEAGDRGMRLTVAQ